MMALLEYGKRISKINLISLLFYILKATIILKQCSIDLINLTYAKFEHLTNYFYLSTNSIIIY